MRLSAKTEYAAVAMLELARRWENAEPVRIREIAEMHGVPQRFLVQILLQLKAAGLVTSTRGAAGGYRLSRPPAAITLEDVRTVVEGPAEPVMLLSGQGAAASTARVLGEAWRQVASRESAALRGLDLATLAARTQPDTEAMYYI